MGNPFKKIKKWAGTIAGATAGGPAGALFGAAVDFAGREMGKDDAWAGPGPPPPHTIVGTPEWLNYSMQTDPMMKELMDRVGEDFSAPVPEMGSDLTQQMMGVGQAQANQAAQGVSNSLAGRGGGIGSSLAIGAQARAQAATAGVAQGMQADLQKYSQDVGRYQAQHDVYLAQRNELLNALTFKFNILNQVMGGYLGQQQAHLGFLAQKESADATVEAGRWSAAGNAVPGIPGIG